MPLPSPTDLRKARRRRVRALLDAQIYLPVLVKRLSAGFITPDERTLCRWAGWMASLQDDPAWGVIEPALEIGEAWPQVWDEARKAGFSAMTEHHQAIFFTRLYERATDASRYELAQQSFERALECWKALADTNYLRHEILSQVAGELSDSDAERVLRTLLDGPLQLVEARAIKSLRIHAWNSSPRRRPLLFSLDILGAAQSAFEEEEDSPLARGITDGAAHSLKKLRRSVADELNGRLKSMDLAVVELDDILDVFDGALVRCRHLRFPPELDRTILRRGLAVIWDLRETERDEKLGIIPPMVERLEPCTDRLLEADAAEFFGLQGAIADLYVFKGEEALSLDVRQKAFEKALEICPDHRNASRLLSYLLLERANRDLLKTAAIPSATSRVDILRNRLQPLLRRAADYIARAEELYPDNDLLDRYRDDLEEEKRRFRLTLEADGDHR